MFPTRIVSATKVSVNGFIRARQIIGRLVAYGSCALILSSFHCSSDSITPDPSAGTAATGGTSNAAGTAGVAGSQNTAGTSSSGGQPAGNAGTAGSTPTERCTSKYGAKMVEIPAPDGSTYCMDTTEATRGHYAEFLKANSEGMTRKDDVCPSETGVMPRWEPHWDGDPNDPDTHEGTCYMEDYHGNNALSPTEADKPMTCITYCQARAYCEWAGKRLCGRIGGGTVSVGNTTDEPYNAAVDEWYNACSQGGTQKFSYGNEYNASACTTSEGVDPSEAENAISSAGGKLGCKGTKTPFDQVYDLIGNVFEWSNACSLVQSGNVKLMKCAQRGSSPLSAEPVDGLDCRWLGTVTPTGSSVDTGFRCCAD